MARLPRAKIKVEGVTVRPVIAFLAVPCPRREAQVAGGRAPAPLSGPRAPLRTGSA